MGLLWPTGTQITENMAGKEEFDLEVEFFDSEVAEAHTEVLNQTISVCLGRWGIAGREQSMKPMIGKSIDQSMTINAN